MNELLYTIAGCFYYFSSTVNPILYNLMSMKYRRAFRETLCGYSGQRGNRMSRDLQSSFRDTTVPLNTMTSTADFRKSVYRPTRHPQPHHEDNSTAATTAQAVQDDGRSSSAADVLVMISPANGNAQCYKTLLRVTVGSKQAANAAAAGTTSTALAGKNSTNYETQTADNQHCIEIETCI